MLRTLALAPVPTLGAPPLAAQIAAIVDELRKFPISNCTTRDRKRTEMYRVRPFLVVEDKFGALHRAQQVPTAVHFGVACGGFRLCGRLRPAPSAGRWISQRLP